MQGTGKSRAMAPAPKLDFANNIPLRKPYTALGPENRRSSGVIFYGFPPASLFSADRRS